MAATVVLHIVLGAGALAGTVATPPGYAQPAETARSYEIPAGDLTGALNRFGRNSGIMLSFSTSLTEGLHTDGLRGTHTVASALGSLLSGTGLHAVMRESGGYVLERAHGPQGTPTLAPVTVTAVIDPGTEGSGSYATDAASLMNGVWSLKDIPQSVSVVTRQQIEDQGLVSSADALNQVTGVTATGYDRTESVTIRGYSVNAQTDGVPVTGLITTISGDLALYDRVEVLRGPSGLLTGSGEPGGTVNYVRKRPLGTRTLSGAVSAGSNDTYRGELDVSTPLNGDGSLRARGVLVRQDQHKFYDVAESRDEIAYGVIEYDLSPRTTVGLSGAYSRFHTNTFWGLPLMSDGSLPGRTAFMGPDMDSVYTIKEAAADIQHHFDSGWIVKATYGYRELIGNYAGAGTTGAVDTATGLATMSATYYDRGVRWNSLDLNVNGPITLLGRKHHLTLGYNQTKQDNLLGSVSTSLPGWDVFNDHNYSGVLNTNIASHRQTITEQSGVYTSARFSLADTVQFILGGRWSDYQSKSRTIAAATSDWVASTAQASWEFTPYGGLIWDVRKNLTLYASYADTFVPQTQEDYLGNILEPRVGWQAEAGAKARFLDDRLNLNVAVFRIRDTNRAMVDPDHVGCGTSATAACYMAAGEVQSDGLDIELVGALSRQWDVSAGYTYTRARYESDTTASNVGERFNASLLPEHLFKLWTHYRFSPTDLNGALQGWSIGAGVQAQSDIYSASVRQGGRVIVSARVGYQINKNWSTAMSVSNLFDRTYLQFLGRATSNNFYGAPRTFMLSLRGRF
ncbi:TonB-dependent receptor [Verticiella sediminum]